MHSKYTCTQALVFNTHAQTYHIVLRHHARDNYTQLEARVPIQGQAIDLYVQTYNVHPSDGFPPFSCFFFRFVFLSDYQTRNVPTGGGISYSPFPRSRQPPFFSFPSTVSVSHPGSNFQEFSVTFFFRWQRQALLPLNTCFSTGRISG